jgi:hypothetical protein
MERLLHHHGIPARKKMPIVGDVTESRRGVICIHWDVKERQSTKRWLNGIALCSSVFRTWCEDE